MQELLGPVTQPAVICLGIILAAMTSEWLWDRSEEKPARESTWRIGRGAPPLHPVVWGGVFFLACGALLVGAGVRGLSDTALVALAAGPALALIAPRAIDRLNSSIAWDQQMVFSRDWRGERWFRWEDIIFMRATDKYRIRVVTGESGFTIDRRMKRHEQLVATIHIQLALRRLVERPVHYRARIARLRRKALRYARGVPNRR